MRRSLPPPPTDTPMMFGVRAACVGSANSSRLRSALLRSGPHRTAGLDRGIVAAPAQLHKELLQAISAALASGSK